MKRNLDLIRHILITIESWDGSSRLTVSSFLTDDTSEQLISEHLALLIDVNYIEVQRIPILGQSYTDYIVQRMTMQGHDYLDTIKNDTVWKEVKKRLVDFGASAPLEVVKSVGTSVLIKLLGV